MLVVREIFRRPPLYSPRDVNSSAFDCRIRWPHVARSFVTSTTPLSPFLTSDTRISKSVLSQDLLATTSPEPNPASDQTWSDHTDADSSNQSCDSDDWHIVRISHSSSLQQGTICSPVLMGRPRALLCTVTNQTAFSTSTRHSTHGFASVSMNPHRYIY